MAEWQSPIVAVRTCSVCEQRSLQVRRVTWLGKTTEVGRCVTCDTAKCTKCDGHTMDPKASKCAHCKAKLPRPRL